MGNALHHGDGLTVAGMSAVESYSIGMTSESRTTTDVSTNISSRRGTANQRSNRGDRVTSRPPPRYDSKYSEKRYDRTDGSQSRTDNSSAYHHGYQMRNDARDDREDISYRGAESSAGTYKDDGIYPEDEGYEYRYEKNYKSYSDISSKQSSKRHNQRRLREQSSTDNNQYAKLDSTVDGMSTSTDIPTAETDMAYAGSEDEENLQAVRDIETRKNMAKSPTSERAMTATNFPHDAIAGQMRRSNYVIDVSDKKLPSVTSSHIKRLDRPTLDEPRAQTLPEYTESESIMQGDSFSTLTKTIATLADDPAVIKKETELNLKKMKESAVESYGQLLRSPFGEVDEGEDEEDDNPAQKQLEELLKQQQLQEEKLQKQLEQLRLQKEKLQQLQDEKVRSTRDGDRSHQSGPTISRQGRNSPELSQDIPNVEKASIAKVSVESSRHERTRRQRLERARQKVMPRSPSKPYHREDKSKASMKGTSEKEPGSVYSFDDVDAVESSERYVNQVNHFLLEEKYAGRDKVSCVDDETSIGTATGEVDASVPEYEDVPSQCKINQSAPAPFQENDLTTMSGSLLSNELPDINDDLPIIPTVSSMKDRRNKGNEAELLDEALSSMEEEIDLDFVAKYDTAFNAFLDAYPALFDKTSDLIQNLKVAKLQRILEVSYQAETELEAFLESPSEVKTSIETEFQNKLREASRKKAERSIQLRAEMNHVRKQSRTMEGVLTWDMVQLSVKRACKLHKIKVELDSRDKLHRIRRDLDRKEPGARDYLIATMPDDPGMDDLRKALKASPKDSFGSKQKRELQQFQVDNAFLSSEVKVLQEKIQFIKEEAKKQEWVDAALLKMDAKKLKKLKTRYQKKIGVTF